MRWKGTRSKFIELLSETPFVSTAAKKVGVARATIYRWIKDDPVFASEVKKAMKLGRNHLNDFAETKMIELISKHSLGAIKFWLQHNHPQYIRAQQNSQAIASRQDVLQILSEAKRDRDQMLKVLRNTKEDKFPQNADGSPMFSDELLDRQITMLENLTDDQLVNDYANILRKASLG